MINKKREKIIIIIGITVAFVYYLSLLLVKETTNLDELWNYNIARNIAKGLVPYKDVSLITTPLLPIIEAIFLKISVNELIVFRVLNAILITSILFATYKVYTKLGVKKVASAILLLPLICLLKDEIFLDYNFFILLLALIVTVFEIKLIDKKTTLKQNLIIGILGGLAICTKQTIGLIMSIEIIIIPLIMKSPKKEIKNVLYRMLGVSIPVFILTMYLIITGALYDFLSYTVLAINTFSNSIPYSRLLSSNDMEIKLLATIMPIFNIGIIVALIWRRKKNRDISTLFLCSIPLLCIQYPIADRIHFVLSNYMIFLIVLLLIYRALYRLYQKIDNDIKKILIIVGETFVILLSIVFAVIGIIRNVQVYIKSEKNTELKYYKSLIVPDYIQNLYQEINFIESKYENQGKVVNILDSNAVAIHIPMDKYIKNYDMFNKGNFGKEGEAGLISEIQQNNNQVYLIKKSKYAKNWQNPTLVTDYIEQNLNKTGEINIYDIYEY